MNPAPTTIKYQGQIYKLAATDAPEQIKFHGQLYVLAATKHKKCPKGQHWNEAARKCMKLPPGLKRAHLKAQATSEKVYKKYPSLPDDDKDEHPGFDRAHGRAYDAHQQAAGLLHEHGFHELALHHEYLGNQHEESYEIGYNRDGTRPSSKDLKPQPPDRSMLKDTLDSYYNGPSDSRKDILKRLNRATKGKR
jgi:hypothetical protein